MLERNLTWNCCAGVDRAWQQLSVGIMDQARPRQRRNIAPRWTTQWLPKAKTRATRSTSKRVWWGVCQYFWYVARVGSILGSWGMFMMVCALSLQASSLLGSISAWIFGHCPENPLCFDVANGVRTLAALLDTDNSGDVSVEEFTIEVSWRGWITLFRGPVQFGWDPPPNGNVCFPCSCFSISSKMFAWNVLILLVEIPLVAFVPVRSPQPRHWHASFVCRCGFIWRWGLVTVRVPWPHQLGLP